MPISMQDAGLTPLEMWAPGRALTSARARLDTIRNVAPEFKRDFLRGKPAIAVRTLPTSIAPYPVTYAFNRACRMPFPFLLFQNRAMLVQFWQKGQPRMLLMNPTIPERSAQAPFFANLAGKLPFAKTIRNLLLEARPIPEQLREIGVRVEDIDYVAFDHQHVQDMRPFLGTETLEPLYPNARYLVQRSDWDASRNLHPLQRPWFVEASGQGVRQDKLVLLDGDVLLGDGCALLFTPGHTWGNQTLLFRATDSGCYTVSENGVCMDAYSPQYSTIPGLAAHARLTGDEVILNGNTLEGSLDQYNSMVKESLCADPYAKDPRFVQHFSSSEIIHSPIAPGLRPTHSIKGVSEGALKLATGLPIA
jgi:hypothetical protein